MPNELFEKYLPNNRYIEQIMDQPDYPLRLPRCDYPLAKDIESHGLLALPDHLSLVDFSAAKKYRSDQYVPTGISTFSNLRILEMAQVVARSFALNDPMNRHVHPPKKMPAAIVNSTHQDAFGFDNFGGWNSEKSFFLVYQTFCFNECIRSNR